MQSLWAGVVASTCAASGHGLSLALAGTQPHKPKALPPAFELHLVTQGSVISHQITLT